MLLQVYPYELFVNYSLNYLLIFPFGSLVAEVYPSNYGPKTGYNFQFITLFWISTHQKHFINVKPTMFKNANNFYVYSFLFNIKFFINCFYKRYIWDNST